MRRAWPSVLQDISGPLHSTKMNNKKWGNLTTGDIHPWTHLGWLDVVNTIWKSAQRNVARDVLEDTGSYGDIAEQRMVGAPMRNLLGFDR